MAKILVFILLVLFLISGMHPQLPVIIVFFIIGIPLLIILFVGLKRRKF